VIFFTRFAGFFGNRLNSGRHVTKFPFAMTKLFD